MVYFIHLVCSQYSLILLIYEGFVVMSSLSFLILVMCMFCWSVSYLSSQEPAFGFTGFPFLISWFFFFLFFILGLICSYLFSFLKWKLMLLIGQIFLTYMFRVIISVLCMFSKIVQLEINLWKTGNNANSSIHRNADYALWNTIITLWICLNFASIYKFISVFLTWLNVWYIEFSWSGCSMFLVSSLINEISKKLWFLVMSYYSISQLSNENHDFTSLNTLSFNNLSFIKLQNSV